MLVNPGGFLRTAADEADRVPQVFVWDRGEVRPVPVPDDDPEAVSDAHLAVREVADGRIRRFADSLEGDGPGHVRFEVNVRAVSEEAAAVALTKEAIQECMEVRR